MASSSVIFKLHFFESGNYHVGGKYDFLDYMNRPEAFSQSEHMNDEYKDYLDYMKNDEKSEGLFDLKKDLLSSDDIHEYRKREYISESRGCPKYIGVMSFRNEFLEANGIINPINKDVNTYRLRNLARSGISAMISNSKKLDEENVYWTAAIHTNTDNIHIHFSILEYEKRYRQKDMIEVAAFDKLKSKVVTQIIGSEQVQKITALSREAILPELKRELVTSYSALEILKSELPDNQSWQYGRKSFEPYRDKVDQCVLGIINSSESLKKKYGEWLNEIDTYEKKLQELYGIGERHLYKDYKKNRLDDFYNRAGNLLLEELKKGQRLSSRKNEPPPAEKKTGVLTSDFSSSSEVENHRIYYSSPRKWYDEDYFNSKRNLAKTIAIRTNQLVNQYEAHVDYLKRQYQYEQEHQH